VAFGGLMTEESCEVNMEPDSSEGFSEESLNMLNTAEGQTNAVFALFGSTAQHAQLLEQALKRFLRRYNQIAKDALQPEDFDVIEASLAKKTMGQLIHEMQKHIEFSDPKMSDRFELALQKRNFLMHHFFLEQGGKLKTQDGRMALLAELSSVDQMLEDGRVIMNAMRIAMCRTLGVEDTDLDKQ
jgi:hypothetical protein